MAARARIAIVGLGKLGSALAQALHAAGFRVDELVVRRHPAIAKALAKKTHARVATVETARLQADVVWICVPDGAIRSVARQLAGRRDWRNQIVLHSSGALSSAELSALKKLGASVGSAHPMMTFAKHAKPRWQGVSLAVEGDAAAARFAALAAKKIGMQPFRISASAKPLYHALGAFCSPLLVALLRAAEEVGAAAGIPAKKVPQLMQPIILQTLENYFAHGAEQAFTGPLLRGDVQTIRMHLRGLGKTPKLGNVYTAVSSFAADRLPVKKRRELLAALRSPSAR